MTTCRFQVKVIPRHAIQVGINGSPRIVYAVAAGPQGIQGVRGPGYEVRLEVRDEWDGASHEFDLEDEVLGNSSIQVYRNGLAEIPGVGFLTSQDGAVTTITMTSTPLPDDIIVVTYNV